MRKTRLLLEAVERAGCQDVTFAALDLCEDSLSDALTALQGKTRTAVSGCAVKWCTGYANLHPALAPYGSTAVPQPGIVVPQS